MIDEHILLEKYKSHMIANLSYLSQLLFEHNEFNPTDFVVISWEEFNHLKKIEADYEKNKGDIKNE